MSGADEANGKIIIKKKAFYKWHGVLCSAFDQGNRGMWGSRVWKFVGGHDVGGGKLVVLSGENRLLFFYFFYLGRRI